MPIFNTGTSGASVLSDPNQAELRRRLNLGDQSRQILPTGSTQIGTTFLRQPENFGSLAQLLATQLQGEGQSTLSRTLMSHLGDVVNRYRAALAVSPELQPDEFLGQFDPAGFSALYSPQERGERPYAYLRGFKLLGG